jgi:hypothetical protein
LLAVQMAALQAQRSGAKDLPLFAWFKTKIAFAMALAIFVSVALWLRGSPTLRKANELIAGAYSSHRPSEMRLVGVRFGHLDQQRGSEISRLDK